MCLPFLLFLTRQYKDFDNGLLNLTKSCVYMLSTHVSTLHPLKPFIIVTATLLFASPSTELNFNTHLAHLPHMTGDNYNIVHGIIIKTLAKRCVYICWNTQQAWEIVTLAETEIQNPTDTHNNRYEIHFQEKEHERTPLTYGSLAKVTLQCILMIY